MKGLRRGLSPRQAFGSLAVVLALALIALVVYLFWYLGPQGLLTIGGETRAGIRPVVTIEGPGGGDVPAFSRPLGAAFGPDGRIYVTDTDNNRVCVFDGTGAFLFEFGGKGIVKPATGAEATWKPGLFNFPAGIDVDDEGNVYVADFYNDQIQVFDSDGTYLRRFPDPLKPVGRGASGSGGTGVAATDVAVYDGRVYVTDAFQILVFTEEGELLAQFGKPGTAPGDLAYPNGIDVGGDGTIYVADSNNNRVQALAEQGVPIWQVGEHVSELSMETGNEFGLPRGITVTDDNKLIVVDSFEFVLKQLDAQGRVEATFGERGVEPAQFNFPNSVDDLGKLLVVADKENDRVQVLELVDERQ